MNDELVLMQAADRAAVEYVASVGTRRVFPDAEALRLLDGFDEALPQSGVDAVEVIAQLDRLGSPNTVVSNGPNYFGFVLGAALPVAAAADRLALAWDQCASSWDGSPVADTLERTAARWLLEILDLPRESSVGFGTSATACSLACLTAARRELLRRKGWDFDAQGLEGAPRVRIVVSQAIHITLKRTARVLGFGMDHVVFAPCDGEARVDPARMPALDDMTILCLQAGEVNTGEFDPFAEIIPAAKAAGAWVHVDGAFGLWARAGSDRGRTEGIELADSWTTDGHKWLNTPYDGAMAICRDGRVLADAMQSDAPYVPAVWDAQKNLTLEFSRRARGIAIWAALKGLGRDGVREMVDRHCRLARRIAEGAQAAGLEVLNRVVLNQVLVRAGDDQRTQAVTAYVQASGRAWFGPAVWEGRPAFRISVSSWRTGEAEADRLIALLEAALREVG
ncbi:pyridoxal phosphate-dependent decarboxylase family protein [Asticcacaulis sp. AC460]|uniref:pyridoxal phosphate-dependent decarboxylase family protein n=1 Tax=Asticcacaulis sp. AC460 TaxID=1282360 RepID=UPI0004136A90|nr:pyridoxal-dependent decarboxylase [Asticcacaulis sp. AC460]